VAEHPIEERRFTDREVREILKRAVENGSANARVTSRGVSLAELKTIGTEVGIDPARLEEAARAVTQGSAPGSNPIAGIPTFVHYERTVDAELDATQTAAIVSLIRRVMGVHGEASLVSGMVEWRTKGGSVERLVSVSSNGGKTTIEGSINLRQAAVGTLISGGIAGSIVTFMGISASVGSPTLNVAGVLLSFGFLAAVSVGLRARIKRVLKSESAKLEQVVHELAQLTRGSGGDSSEAP
jgi:hypothetical protein